MSKDLIVVRQLPIIEEQLLNIKAEIETRVNDALSLDVTEDTVKEVKAVRAALSKDFQELESKRKEVKGAIMSPYEKFEEVYKECVTNIYKPADAKLAAKIREVEDGLKAKKEDELIDYYGELCEAKGIDFIPWERAEINVTLSASKKSLMEKVKAFLDKVSDDLELIGTQENAAEILTEYKQILSASAAILIVKNRMEAIEAERIRLEEAKAAAEAKAAVAEEVEKVIEEEKVEAPEEVEEKPEEKLYSASFTVTDTMAKIKALKEFLIKEGINYEQF